MLLSMEALHVVLIILHLEIGLQSVNGENSKTVCDLCDCSTEGNGTRIDCLYKNISDLSMPIFPGDTNTLILRNNRIKTLQRKYFEKMPFLQHLDVSYNILKSVEDDCFDDLLNLTVLDMKGVDFPKLPLSVAKLINLKKLQMSGTSATRIPHEYSRLHALEEIEFSDSKQFRCKMNLEIENFRSISNISLKILNVSHCDVWEYESGFITFFPTLKVLDISCNVHFGGNNLRKLLNDLTNMSVETLYASGINTYDAITLDEELVNFIYKGPLQNIIMHQNKISDEIFVNHQMTRRPTYISLGDFVDGFIFRTNTSTKPPACKYSSNITTLMTLDAETLIFQGSAAATECFSGLNTLGTNAHQIERMDDTITVNYTELNAILHEFTTTGCCRKQKITLPGGLGSEYIHSLPYCLLSNVTHLRLLNCKYFNKIPPSLFYELLATRSGKFSLVQSFLERLAEEICVCIYAPTLRSLDIINFKNTYIIKHIQFKLVGLHYVQRLTCENCGIEAMHVRLISSFPSLIYLSLAKNKMGTFFQTREAASLFQNNTKLETLDISGNQIITFPEKIFLHQKKLKYLILKNNKIAVWSVHMDTLEQLRELDLSNNVLRSISERAFKTMEKLSANLILSLQGNNIDCSCNAKTFIAWLKNTKVILQSKDTLMCSDKKSLVVKVQLDCDIVSSFIWTGLTAVSLIFIFAFLVYLRQKLRYKWHLIKYRYFRNRGRLPPEGLPNDDEHFDLFVSYSSKDHDWVWNIFRNEIEELGYKVFIHEIHFQVGGLIADNIVHAIDICPKTAVILSDNFMTSEWCMFELNMALVKGHVIPIQLTPVSRQNRTRLVKFIEKSFVYLTWPGNEAEIDRKAFFWNKLEQALRKKK